MRTVTKTVHFCDFCKKQHRFTRPSMERHEKNCIKNPDRSECVICEEGWHEPRHPAEPEELRIIWREASKVEKQTKIREAVEGCPACILAFINREGIWSWEFNYQAEKVEFFKNEDEEWREQC